MPVIFPTYLAPANCGGFGARRFFLLIPPEVEVEAFARIADGNLILPVDARRLYVTRRTPEVAPISTELEWPLDTEERTIPWSALVSPETQPLADGSGETDIFLIVEWSPWLWIESGPWRGGEATG